MATNSTKKTQETTIAHSIDETSDPFRSMFDGENTDDEWWEEEDTLESVSLDETEKQHTPELPRPIGLGVTNRPINRISTRKAERRYSVQRPTRDKSKGRQKKQNAKAGIKVITNVSRHQPMEPPVQLSATRTVLQPGCFVDLAALQALSGEQSQSQSSTGFWKSRKNKQPARSADPGSQRSRADSDPDNFIATKGVERRKEPHVPSPLKLGDDLSPNDRPIVIGISIPSASLHEHDTSPETAFSTNRRSIRDPRRASSAYQDVETPTIIITPAQQYSSTWSPLDSSTSIYPNSTQYTTSRSTKNAPPVPVMPTSFLEKEKQRVAAQRSYFSPDSDDVTTWGDDEEIQSATKSRVMSTCTVFEEDESPILAKKTRARAGSAASRWDGRASISTVVTQRQSKGWWNYITTPFLTRSNTFTTLHMETEHPPLPDLAVAAAKAQEAERDGKKWEKQFSPLTPETSTTISSDSWWNLDSKISKSPVIKETRHKVQTSTSTLPDSFSETAGFGTTIMTSIAFTDAEAVSPYHEASSDSQKSSHGTQRSVTDASVLQSNNPFTQSSLGDVTSSLGDSESSRAQAVLAGRAAILAASSHPMHLPSPPPPPYSPTPQRRKYQAVFPPNHGLAIQNQQPQNEQPQNQQPLSPGPLSPGLQEIMSSRGDIPMSTVPLTPPRRPINLNSGYPELPVRQNGGQFVTAEVFPPPPVRAIKAEAQRQRYEKEDAIARRAGGWWRGRGCIPESGCYGRTGAEGRKRRRWYLGLIIGFLAMIILIVVLATTLHRQSNAVVQPSQWLNLTGFPPVYLGMSTVIAPDKLVANTGCVFPATEWSCDLPKELQSSVAPNQPNQPNFFLYIQWDNSSSANATFSNVTSNPNLGTRNIAPNPVSAGHFIRSLILKARQVVTFVPSPAPPSYAEEFFLGNTTDGIVSSNKAGEPTPFYISFLGNVNSTLAKRDLFERDNTSDSSSQFPNITSIIPNPSVNPDGTAVSANLLPFPTQQPIRLYDRGLATEHYGFYNYFDRSIFLKSIALLNSSNLNNGEVPDDENGGATEAQAKYRCTWTQTRFLVQMWTRMNTAARLLNSSSTSQTSNLIQPGSFPYPVTITTDRHGGNPSAKLVYCYEMNSREGIIAGSGVVQTENRGFGGVDINPAPGFFSNSSDPGLGGFDGGSGGCSCQWSNFQTVLGG